jgi:hypothetical protein
MTSFDYPKHKQNKLKLHDNVLEFKVHLESKIILIQSLDKEEMDKINVQIIYNLQIFLWP